MLKAHLSHSLTLSLLLAVLVTSQAPDCDSGISPKDLLQTGTDILM